MSDQQNAIELEARMTALEFMVHHLYCIVLGAGDRQAAGTSHALLDHLDPDGGRPTLSDA